MMSMPGMTPGGGVPPALMKKRFELNTEKHFGHFTQHAIEVDDMEDDGCCELAGCCCLVGCCEQGRIKANYVALANV